MKKTICVFLAFAVMIAALPGCATVTKPPRPETKGYTLEDVCDLAKNEGKVAAIDTGCIWTYTGLLLPVVGSILSLNILPEIPRERLEGKSAQYVQAYTKCFQDEARGRQFGASLKYFGPIFVFALCVTAYLVATAHH